jgi:hypothetical protein
VIDLGNNARRFGLWDSYINWQEIFRAPTAYMDGLFSDEEIEKEFVYEMPDKIRKLFSKSEGIEDFNMKEEYVRVTRDGLRPKAAIEKSLDHHERIIKENSEDYFDAHELVELLEKDIEYKLKQYSYCISKSTDNYLRWLREEYERKLKQRLREAFM